MSLTQHLRGSLGQWVSQHCPAVPVAAQELAAAVRQRTRVSPPEGVDREHLAAVGGAVDARLALAVDAAPPYGALLGAVQAGAMSVADAGRAACTWPTHQDVPPEDAPVGVWLRTVPNGQWAVFQDAPNDTGRGVPRGLQVVLDELRELASTVPPGTLGSTQQEQRLAELCLVVDELEAVYRSGHIGPVAAAVLDGQPIPVCASRRDDVIAVVQHNAETLHRARSRANTAALGTSAPILLPRWADGDLILGRRGTEQAQTLVDVKTSMAGHRTERVEEWLRQIVAYALLDGRDAWQIRRVGLWLARSGRIYSWSLSEFTGALEHERIIEFRRMVKAAYLADRG